MSTTTNPEHGSTVSLGPADPLEQYEFTTVLTVTGQDTREPETHELHATRTYRTIQDVTAVWPGCSDLANLIRHFIRRPITIEGDATEPTPRHGVDISIVFKTGTAGRFHPTDIRLANVSVDRFDIAPGFWQINDRLEQLLTEQTPGLVATQIPYRGRKYETETPFATE